MTKFQIRILLHNGSTSYFHTEVITAKRFNIYRGYYEFLTEDDKMAYYPVDNVIVNEI